MQFIKNGPDIPEHLLQAHEDGRVVFFCGAGISNPAGLPGFAGLVDQIYLELCTQRNDIEDKAYEHKQYDKTLDLLEQRIPGKRTAVRKALAKVLKPRLRLKNATTTHRALLQLACDRKNNTRLITTNFDRIFQTIIEKTKHSIPIYPAPQLPIPKNSRWHGIVHLHGLLPKNDDEDALNRLVLTSGDFGLAYLVDRWAARFVSELFRNYIVCFVGYGINDPVLRYMMDALAADRMLGEHTPQAYAFGSCEPGNESQETLEWKAKGVTPIIYQLPSKQDHSMLHQTIKKWSETYRDGILGKEEIITKYVVNPPIESTLEDNFIGRILWAISDKSGVPAKRFATLDPVPPIAWLESLTNNQFDCADLPRFGVTPNSENDKPTKFSFLKRHAPYTLSPSMALVSSGNVSSNWDSVMLELANWLLRHLNDPKLVLWIAKQGGQLHQRFAQLIKNKIENLDKLAIEDKEKLDRILLNSPNAIPNQNMRTLWRLVLSGRLKLDRDRPDLYNWLKRTEQNGVTATLKLELRVILEPRIKLSEPFQRNDKNINATNPQKIRDLVDWSIALSAEYAHSAFNKQKDNPYWKTALPDLFQDINMLLRDTLDLMQELGGACSKSDLSYIAQPSISPHPQNKHYHDWTTLIELARDAWLATAKISDNQARLLAEAWWHTPYPLFKRLALFAAAQETIVAPKKSLAWLLSDGSWWLWSNEVRRETIRLLVALAPKLNAEELIHLEQTILQGPPKNIFRGEIEPERYITIVDREILVRLSNIQATGVKITPESEIKLKVISNQNPQWIIGERDEFSSWTESSSDVTNNPWHKFLAVPRQRENLVAWLKKYPSKDYWNKDDWHQCCRDAFELTTGALCDLAHQDIWPTGRWKEALQAWNEERLLELSWKYVAPIIVVAPESLIKNCACEIGHWLRSIAKNCNGHDEIFFELIKGLLKRTPDNELPNSDLVYEAINHPIGIATEALLRWWYQKSPQDNQKLIDPFISIFIELCNTSIKKFIYGRILLAAHTIALFRVDRSWATTYLLPLFDWKKSKIEAQAAWKGFLWSPQPYLPLLSAIKQPLLATAEHYGRLGKHAKQYADLLTFVALEPGDDFTNENLAQAIIKLPTDGLKNSVQALGRALKGSGEKRGEYWHNRVLPYWKNIWPKSNDLILPEISESIACLCIDTSERFPDALNVLKDWLIPIKYPDYVIELLHQADLPTKFPEDSLELMNRIISEDTPWAPRKLSECLKEIITISSNLKTDIRYNRLLTYLKAHE